MIQVDDDVQNVANDLRDIDPHLRLRYSEAGEYWVVYWCPDGGEDGDGYLVTTAQELDQRVVTQVRKIHHGVLNDTYKLSEEIERLDAVAKAEEEHAFTERMGDTYERLAHALREGTGRGKRRIYVP